MLTRTRLPPPATHLGEIGVTLRPECDVDVDFVRDLYVSTRQEEFASSGWPEDTKRTFLHDQFRMQCLHYRNVYYDASFEIVLHDATPIGRRYLHRGRLDYRVVDISLVPEWRGRGVGSELMRAVQAEALEAGCKVSVHVEVFNPARNLYRRLGFVEVEDKGVYLLMEWRGDGPVGEHTRTAPPEGRLS